MGRFLRRVSPICVGFAFWLAVVLGVGYPVLFAGIATHRVPPEVLFVVCSVHAGALVAGHSYRGPLGAG